MANNPRYMISDNKGVLWSDDGYDARETGAELMAAVENGYKKLFVKKYLGDSWTGDLVLVQEISRTR